jgi:HPt (histidine-containing phosphotransfer) domain-containing protein
MTAAFDHDELMDRIDGDVEFLEESIEMLDEDVGPLLEKIRSAVVARDAGALVAPAHTLKGLLSNFCAGAAEATARDLEMRGRESRLEEADAVVDALDRDMTQLRAELQTFLGDKRA